MADKPIIFGDQMVQAILDGRKTVTRRVGKTWAAVQPGRVLWVKEAYRTWTEDYWDDAEDDDGVDEYSKAELVAYRATPRVGRRRWLKRPPPTVPGFQDEPHRVTYLDESTPLERNPNLLGPWETPYFMPRWACRIDLEVVSVTEQRGRNPYDGSLRAGWVLPDLDDDEARREGVADRRTFLAGWHAMHRDHDGPVYRIEFVRARP